jgi:hypothetical protein
MNAQKSQKGRLTATTLLEDVGRRKTRGKKNPHPGRQQFGGSGTVARLDRNVETLSRKTREALQEQPRRKRIG